MSIADKLALIAENEQKVFEAGYEKGKNEGGGGDATAAYEQGVADGKQSEYDAFWDAYQDNGNRTDYQNCFSGRGWTDETYKPKYDIDTIHNYMVFRRCGFKDLGETIRKSGKRVIFRGNSLQYTFQQSQDLEVIDGIEFITPITYVSGGFSYCPKLRKIQTLTIAENATTLDFDAIPLLEEIEFNGTIPVNISIKDSSKLSTASIKSIINALSDTAVGKTLTLSKTAVENAFSESKKTTIPFGFDTDYDGVNITVVDNGNGTVTVNGDVPGDTEFEYRELEITFPAGSYIISEPIHNMGYVSCWCYDLEGNKLPMEYVGENGETNQSILNADDSFVVKACVYLAGGDYTDYVIPYPTIQLANSFEVLIATKPNWTINLV